MSEAGWARGSAEALGAGLGGKAPFSSLRHLTLRCVERPAQLIIIYENRILVYISQDYNSFFMVSE